MAASIIVVDPHRELLSQHRWFVLREEGSDLAI
jgi:hypothetical protein